MALSEQTYKTFKEDVFNFLWTEIEPLNAQIEATHHIPHDELFPKFRRKGLFGLIIPQDYGGVGLSIGQYLPILAEISKVSGAIRGLIHVHNTSARAIVVYGREEQKKVLLPKLASGELSIAFCITEANAGTGLDIKTSAIKKDNHYILNGEKHLITNADFTQLFMVACYTNKELGAQGLSAILIERGTPGFTIDAMPHLMGCRGLGHGILTFKTPLYF